MSETFLKSSIKENIENIRKKIELVAIRRGRKPEDIKLVAVTKGVTTEKIREALDGGVNIFGENYVQEARRKIHELGDKGIEWHLIGHLQKNKAKEAVRHFAFIHSLDSLRLAIELDNRARELGINKRVLIQVNIAKEETKSGVLEDEVIEVVSRIRELKNLSLEGLMILPPYREDSEKVRPYFKALRLLKEKVEMETGLSLKELSMGMSHDFEVAVEEGATMVRIGTAIFG